MFLVNTLTSICCFYSSNNCCNENICFGLIIQYNSSGVNSAGNSDSDENTKLLKSQIPTADFLFDQCVASFDNESPKEALLYGLLEMGKNEGSLDIVEIVQDFEADEIVLFQKLFVDRKKQVGIMFNYIDVLFRLYESSTDTMIACLLDELDMLRVFLAKNEERDSFLELSTLI